MKVCYLILVAGLVFCPACKKKELTTGEKLKETMDDALNRRDNEEMRDALENAEKAAKDLAKEAKKAAEEALEEVKGEKKD